MNQPSITTIIPAYNCERYLAEAIESALAQRHHPHEIIVVDDGSTDDTAKVARRFEPAIRYSFQPNGGIGSARNCGIDLARGDLIAFLDADDLWLEGKLERQVQIFVDDPATDAVFGLVQQFDDTAGRAIDAGEPMAGYLASTMLIKRASFDRVGPFRTDIKLGEFVDWYMRAKEKGLHSQMLAEVVLRRRIHDNNIGVRHRDSTGDYARLLKDALDRRRRSEG
ncbi:MAG: glycosyltransferase family A protein [Candidatus Binatus sp.]|jgi:glycosyltransferase involved in cell wall biosynthesis